MNFLEFWIHTFIGNQYFCGHCTANWGFPGGSVVKNPPVKRETQVWSLCREDPLEKGMGTHSSILAREIPWTEEPGGLHSMGSQELDIAEQRSRQACAINCLLAWQQGHFVCRTFTAGMSPRMHITMQDTMSAMSHHHPRSPRHLFFLSNYFWLCWVFVAACRLSLVVASGGYSSLRCAGFWLRWLLQLQSTGIRCMSFSSCHTLA